MNCASCGQTNPTGSRFCSGCGASLAPRCDACGTENPAGARFCNGCGTALAARPAADAVSRKIVTVVFADLIGSVALHERLDAESARRLMDRYHRAMAAAVDVHGGRVVQLLGDGVLAGFGVPRVAEDDAIRAVRAAVGMQRAFRELAREQGAAMENVGLRVAVNTGEIVVGDDENSVMGDPTNVAARLQQEARDGDVIVGEGTQRLVGELVTLAPLGVFALRGRAETVAAYRVVSLDRPPSRQATAFVGRDGELRRLGAVYDAAVAGPAARLAVLLGSPGLGKSRLVAEFTRRAGERATVLAARCDAAGGATFAPLAEALRALLRIDEGAGGDVLRAAIDSVMAGDDAERTRIATGIGALLAGTPAPPEETFFVVRRLLAALAVVRPVVLVIDDLQWAEPLLLDLVEHLVQWGAGVPLLVLVAARPELRDARSAIATPGALVADVVTLAGLDAGAATRLAANVIGGAELPAALAGRVLATSEGNPLFVSELVRMLVQDGTLQRQGDRWITTVEVSKLDMPPTIHVLLAARIERLRPEERSVLERAAVVGRQFSRAAVAHLLRDAIDLDARLEALRRSELIEPDTGWFLGEPALRFHHVLIRDAAYRRVLKETRAELHARIADWIVDRVGDAIEHDETIGWHLEQAHQHLRELGPLDANGRSLGERAARYLGAAGRRALARDDLPLAASLLGRAIDRLDPGDGARADLALDWCEALLAAGDVGPAVAAIEELGRFCADSERLRAWHTCFAGQLAALTDPQALRTTADAVAAAAEQLAALEDAAGEAKAHFVHAMALVRLGKVGACEAALDRALAAARRARDRRRANAVLAGAPVAALWGPSPVTRASGRCLDVVRVLRITQGAPAVEAVALRCQGVLEALRGRTDAARRMVASSRRLVEELGITQRLLESDVFAGHVELIEGDAEAAEGWLRTAYEGLRDLGLGIDAAQAGALLGRALLAQGRASEAEALSHESEALAGDDLKAAITWRGVRAEALARRGEHVAAIEFARAAVEIAAATDDLLDHADARQSLAVALRAAGRGAEADAEEMRAIELWEAKGATLLVERARDRGGRAAAPEIATSATSAPRRAVPRRVSANSATAEVRRLEAAIAARDADALANLFDALIETVHHPTGVTYDRDGARAIFEPARLSKDLSLRHEPLATLGDSLALCRQWSASSATVYDDVDVGAIERESLWLSEVDARGRRRRSECFADDHLADAIARLYERHAEVLPEGPERERAATTTRAVRIVFGLDASPNYRGVIARDDYAFVDHRVLGYPSYQGARGVEQLRASDRALRELAVDTTVRVDEIFALQADALLVRSTATGTHREWGGRFERPMLQIRTFDAAGSMNRTEWFDVDDVAAALARFDELTGERLAVRPVRPNAATAAALRVGAVVASRDVDALGELFGGVTEVVDHPTGAEFGGDALLATWAVFLRAQDAVLDQEILASLGGSLALIRGSMSFSELAEHDGSFGAVRRDELVLIEVGADGRQRRLEFFALDHLADAVARLYERYAELQPEGAARESAALTARAVSAIFALGDSREYAALAAHDTEFVDHRLLGFPAMRGVGAVPRGVSLHDVADGIAVRVDDVLDLLPTGLLVRSVTSGTDRSTGGRFEREIVQLRIFGPDGRVERTEWFDGDQAEEARARFAVLMAPPLACRVRPNAATAHASRLDAAAAARDFDAFASLLADDAEAVDHRTGTTYEEREALPGYRALLQTVDLAFAHQPLATLGDSLALCHASFSFSQTSEVIGPFGAVASDFILLAEVDAAGRRRYSEFFATDHLRDAIARLYARHVELLPDGVAHVRAAATARAVAMLLSSPDPEQLRAVFDRDAEYADHKLMGWGRAQGADILVRGLRAWLETAEDIATRVDEVLGLRADAFLVRWTVSGTSGMGGGPFENRVLWLCSFGSSGLLTRWEQFESDRDAEALARFDELAAPRTPARRVRPNAATANNARLVAAVAARDGDAIARVFADDAETLHHATGIRYDRDVAVARLQALLEARDLAFDDEPLATLGDSLELGRGQISYSALVEGDIDVGAVERDQIVLVETGADGRRRRSEIFSDDQLGAAIARLYERYAELMRDGAERERVAATARTIATVLSLPDPDRYARVIAPDLELVDRRRAGLGTLRGAEAYLNGLRALLEIAEEHTRSVDEVLALRSEALLVRLKLSGTLRASGGAYESVFLVLYTFGADGRETRNEQFDADDAVAALARFDELTAEPPSPRFANAGSRAVREFERRWHAGDWDGVLAMHGSNFVMDDRRAMVRMQVTGGEFLENLRLLFLTRVSRFQSELLATRGERLSLSSVLFRGEVGDGAPIEIPHLAIVEVATDGTYLALVLFDPGEVDAAYAELDARFAAGEGAAHVAVLARKIAFQAARNGRDWDVARQLLPADFTMRSHRRLANSGMLLDRDAFIRALSWGDESGVSSSLRVEHLLRLSATAMLEVVTLRGSVDGGDFEQEFVLLFGHDGSQLRSCEAFDVDQLDAAFARYEELSRPPATPARIENAATRSFERFSEAWDARDWERVAAIFAPGFRLSDRRSLMHMELDRDAHLRSLRSVFEMPSARYSNQVIATRGDRLVLSRGRWDGADHAAGPSELEWLLVLEVDERGDRIAIVTFDPDEREAAYAELDARYAAGEAAAERRAAVTGGFLRAFANRDWDALAALLAPDLVVQDHRLLGWEPLHGPAAYIHALQSLVELAPDVQLRLDHVSMRAPRFLYVTTWVGTRDGGAFETPSVIVSELDPDGRIRRFDQHDLDRLDEVRARFEASAASPPRDLRAAGDADGGPARFAEPRPDLLRIPPNAVTRAMERWNAAAVARDWDAVEGLFAPEFHFDDRRRGLRDSGDRAKMLASIRVAVGAGVSAAQETLATSGERLALLRIRFTGGDGNALRFEVDTLQVAEVDAAGRLVACITFDPDDRRAASAEMTDRYLRSHALASRIGWLHAFFEAVRDRDPDRIRAAWLPGHSFHDHRRTGLGRIDAPEPYVASLVAIFESAPDVLTEDLYQIVEQEHASLSIARAFGTLATGGAFESVFVRLHCLRAGQTATELFELEDLDAARARFEALRPDPLHIPPNAATRAGERCQAAFEAADWDALVGACAQAMTFEDRRPSILLSGDRDMFLAGNRVIASNGGRPSRTVLATAGDRLALEQLRWTGANGDVGAFEAENLSVIEVDGAGRVAAIVVFDADDRRAASIEMFDRYFRGEGARLTPPATIELVRAGNAHDLAAMRAALPDDYFFHDHRRTGVGRIDNADDYVASFAAVWELSPDMATDTLYHVAVAEHGSLNVGRMFGTLADGGAFESIFVRLGWYENGRSAGTELFELEDLDRARELFESRRPDPLRIPPNAATRVMDRLRDAREARDWDAVAVLCAPSMVFDDRRRGTLLRGDRDMFLASARVVASYDAQISPVLLATAGDRLALRRLHFGGSAGGGPVEADVLSLIEVDAEGRIAAIVSFDPEDRCAASAELTERFARGPEAPPFVASSPDVMRALIERDIEPLRAALPEDFVVDDHRRAGIGRVEGAEAFIQSFHPLYELSPDLVVESLYTVASGERALLDMAHMFGTLATSGGEFESVYLRLFSFEGDRIVAMELFESDDLDAARARFETLRHGASRSAPNAATRLSARIAEAFTSDDWQTALRALAGPGFRFEDRGKRALVDGDVEVWLRNLEVVRAWPGRRTRLELLETFGDRVALERIAFTGGADGRGYEGEFLRIVEADADGLLHAVIHFDLDDRDVAVAEARARS